MEKDFLKSLNVAGAVYNELENTIYCYTLLAYEEVLKILPKGLKVYIQKPLL